MKNIAKELIKRRSITTTLAKAKAVRQIVGGSTRIVKLGTRLGDGAQLAKISLIEKEKPKEVEKKLHAKTHKTNKTK